MPIFRVKSVKIYTGQKNLHWRRRPRRRQLSGMIKTIDNSLGKERKNVIMLIMEVKKRRYVNTMTRWQTLVRPLLWSHMAQLSCTAGAFSNIWKSLCENILYSCMHSCTHQFFVSCFTNFLNQQHWIGTEARHSEQWSFPFHHLPGEIYLQHHFVGVLTDPL